MIDFFQKVIQFFTSLGAFVWNIALGVKYLVTVIPKSLVMLTYSVGFMPTILVAFALALISVSVVYLVIGR